MNLIDQVKKVAGNYVLKEALEKVNKNPEPVSFLKSTKIALLFYATQESDMIPVFNLITFLQEQKKHVFTIGTTAGFPVPKSKVTNLNFIVVKEEEITWNGIPKSYRIKNYQDTEFDLLIDLSQEFNLIMDYILASTRAKVRIGKYDAARVHLYHFMIETTKKPDILAFTEQIKEYLFTL